MVIFFRACCILERKGNTVIKLLRRLGVKVEVFEEFGCPVLVVTLAVTPPPPQVAPRILQLQETHSLQEQQTHGGVSYNRFSRWKDRKFIYEPFRLWISLTNTFH